MKEQQQQQQQQEQYDGPWHSKQAHCSHRLSIVCLKGTEGSMVACQPAHDAVGDACRQVCHSVGNARGSRGAMACHSPGQLYVALRGCRHLRHPSSHMSRRQVSN